LYSSEPEWRGATVSETSEQATRRGMEVRTSGIPQTKVDGLTLNNGVGCVVVEYLVVTTTTTSAPEEGSIVQ